jgi:hypothetical protein
VGRSPVWNIRARFDFACVIHIDMHFLKIRVSAAKLITKRYLVAK